MWAIIIILHREEIGHHPERVTNLWQYISYDWSDLEFPVSPRDIHIWERNNNIRVNVLGLRGSNPYMIYNSQFQSQRHLNLSGTLRPGSQRPLEMSWKNYKYLPRNVILRLRTMKTCNKIKNDLIIPEKIKIVNMLIRFTLRICNVDFLGSLLRS